MDTQDSSADRKLRETCDYRETLAALREAIAEMENGDTLPIEEAFAKIKQKHGLPD